MFWRKDCTRIPRGLRKTLKISFSVCIIRQLSETGDGRDNYI